MELRTAFVWRAIIWHYACRYLLSNGIIRHIMYVSQRNITISKKVKQLEIKTFLTKQNYHEKEIPKCGIVRRLDGRHITYVYIVQKLR